MKKTAIMIAILFFLPLSFASFTPQSGYDLFQKALAKERAEGNLEEAIQLYKQIVQNFADDRALAAKALLQMGKCYEKMGKSEARNAYTRVLQDYSDQIQQVEEARARLASLDSVGGWPRFTKAAGENEGITFRKIEFPGEQSTHLARLSPDGTKMLYVHFQDKKPRFSLYVMDLSSGQEKPLIEGVEAGETNFFEWSPDGKKIVYKYGRCELRVIGSDGEDLKVLWSSADPNVMVYPADWSRDGRNILCAVINPADWTLQLAVLPSSGGEPRFIITGGLNELSEHAQLSPDGKYIVSQKTKAGNTDLFIWSVDGSQEIQLTENSAKDDYPLWSPDGKYIVFTSDRAKTVDLWAIPMQGAKPAGDPVLIKRNLGKNTRLTDYTPSGVLTMFMLYQGGVKDLFVLPVDPLTGKAQDQFLPFARYPTGHFQPRWSPDGKRVAYTSRKGDIGRPRIFVSSGSEKEDIEIPVRDYIVNGVEWSRDGEYLIFPGLPSFDPGARAGIFRVSLKDFGIEPIYLGDRPILPEFKGLFVNLRWLPQANKFMFEKIVERITDKSLRYGIYTMDREGKNVQLVTDKIQSSYWAWPSPNGKYLAYEDAGDLKLWSLDEDAFIVTLAKWEGFAWSPDSRQGAFKDKKQIKVFSLPEKASRVLAEAGENSEIAGGVPWFAGLAWSPDGQTIAYLLKDMSTGSKAQSELWTVPAAGGTPRKIADPPEGYPVLGELSWHPSGKMIVVTGEAAGALSRLYEHWVMENFLPKLKASK
jgi:Tol biopolymer transport system component